MHKILVVEDESVIRAALRRLLERNGYNISEAGSVHVPPFWQIAAVQSTTSAAQSVGLPASVHVHPLSHVQL